MMHETLKLKKVPVTVRRRIHLVITQWEKLYKNISSPHGVSLLQSVTCTPWV